jgi:hypothetical protein
MPNQVHFTVDCVYVQFTFFFYVLLVSKIRDIRDTESSFLLGGKIYKLKCSSEEKWPIQRNQQQANQLFYHWSITHLRLVMVDKIKHKHD